MFHSQPILINIFFLDLRKYYQNELRFKDWNIFLLKLKLFIDINSNYLKINSNMTFIVQRKKNVKSHVNNLYAKNVIS